MASRQGARCGVQGVTHVAGAPLLAAGRRRRSHFAHPLDFEFQLVGDQLPPPADWPTLYFQVLVPIPWGPPIEQQHARMVDRGRQECGVTMVLCRNCTRLCGC